MRPCKKLMAIPGIDSTYKHGGREEHKVSSFFINCGLIALVWWSADKLTWDCTLIDEQEEDSGEGLLETIGLDRPDHTAIQREIGDSPSFRPSENGTIPLGNAGIAASWWDRFVERRRRPHAPGVWVVYFSLAALPLFGLGQLLIPARDTAARQYAFQLLFVYTASGLGLLLSTSFLGLRRYLRQRRQEMPLMMVNLWLSIGLVLIVGVMFAAMLLPRPNAEYTISELPIRVGSPDQNASPYGMGSEGVEEKQPDARAEQRDDAPPDSPTTDQSGKTKTPSPDGKGKMQGDSKESDNTSGESGKKRSHDEQPSKQKPDHKSKPADSSDPAKAKPPEKTQPRQTDGGPKPAASPQTPTMPRVTLPHDFSSLAALFKWILYAILAVLLAYAVWKNGPALLAGLRDLWNSLFGVRSRQSDKAAEEAAAKKPPPRHFSDFTNPFATGAAGRCPPKELVRYTFEALEAWAQDKGHPRLPDQTPHEFARCIGSAVASLADDARQLSDLYCQVAYASDTLSPASVAQLSHLWLEMQVAAGPR